MRGLLQVSPPSPPRCCAGARGRPAAVSARRCRCRGSPSRRAGRSTSHSAGNGRTGARQAVASDERKSLSSGARTRACGEGADLRHRVPGIELPCDPQAARLGRRSDSRAQRWSSASRLLPASATAADSPDPRYGCRSAHLARTRRRSAIATTNSSDGDCFDSAIMNAREGRTRGHRTPPLVTNHHAMSRHLVNRTGICAAAPSRPAACA